MPETAFKPKPVLDEESDLPPVLRDGPDPLPRYEELHCLSNFSFQRGASHPQELVQRAHELGYAAVAITDECSLAGIVRALEVLEATGRSIAAFQQQTGPVIVDPDSARKIVVLPDRAVLHQRINGRFEAMLEQGAEDEVRALLALNLPAEMPAMKAIGVSQIAAMFRGELTRDEVIDRGSAATRQYAKRQMTWFRNQMDDSWERMAP